MLKTVAFLVLFSLYVFCCGFFFYSFSAFRGFLYLQLATIQAPSMLFISTHPVLLRADSSLSKLVLQLPGFCLFISVFVSCGGFVVVVVHWHCRISWILFQVFFFWRTGPEDLRRERSAALGVQCSVSQALKTPRDTVDLGALLFSLYATPVLLFSSVI